MAVVTRTRKRDGATVYYAKYRVGRRQITEKVGAVKAGDLLKVHDRMKARAVNRDHKRQLEVENGTWVDPRKRKIPQPSFRQLVDRFLRDYRTRSGRDRYYREQSKAWLAHFGKKAAAEITVEDVDRFRKARERRVAASTVRKDLVSLSTLFRWAKARGLVPDNPADADLVKRPSEPKHRAGYLSALDLDACLGKCPGWLALPIRWCAATGMDRGEVLELAWPDIDETAGIVHAPRGKTGAARVIPLTPKTRAILRDARRLRTVAGHRRVFLGPDGKPISVEAANYALRRAYLDAGLVVSGPWKMLRHTFGSRLAMADVAPQMIARLMGHTTQAVTDRYMHLSSRHLRDRLEQAEEGRPQEATKGAAAGESASTELISRLRQALDALEAKET